MSHGQKRKPRSRKTVGNSGTSKHSGTVRAGSKRKRENARKASSRKAVSSRRSARHPSAKARLSTTRPKFTGTDGKSLDDLDLSKNAREAADALVKEFGARIVFTSGRRTVSEQANAMAVNVVKERQYIVKTYAHTAERTELQKWVDDHPEAKTKEAIAKGLLTTMKGWTPEQIRHITYHVTGDAFDIAPVGGDDGKRIKDWMPKLPHYGKFLDKEAGLPIWHLQVQP